MDLKTVDRDAMGNFVYLSKILRCPQSIKLLLRCIIKPIATVSHKWINRYQRQKGSKTCHWSITIYTNETCLLFPECMNWPLLSIQFTVLRHVQLCRVTWLFFLSVHPWVHLNKCKTFLQPYFNNIHRFTFNLIFPWKRHIMTTRE